MTVKLPKKRNNLLEEMNPKWDCIVSRNTCFQQIFIATEKKSKEIFFYCKRIWKTQEKSNFDLFKNHEYADLQRVEILKSFMSLIS